MFNFSFDKRIIYAIIAIMVLTTCVNYIRNPNEFLNLLFCIPGVLVAITFHEFVDWGSGGNVVYNDRDIYALVSVHKTDGKNYIRLHGVYKNKPSL